MATSFPEHNLTSPDGELTLVDMIQELPRVGSDEHLAPCHGVDEFTQVTNVKRGQLLVRHYCDGCPLLSACTLLAVATLEQYGQLFGVWAGQVMSLDVRHTM